MKRRQWFYVAGGAVLVVAAFVWALRPRPVPVEVAEVKRGAFEQTVEEAGKTRVRERYVVSSPLAGRLARIQLRPGDAVEAGKPVALLSPSAPALLDARTVRELRERVGVAEADLARAKAEVARAAAALEQAQFDVRRTRKLEAEGFLSSAAREQAELTARVQLQALAAARSAVTAATHGVEQARAALTRAREEPGGTADGTLPVIAPVSGRVLRVLQESEAVVAMGTPLLEIADPTDLEIVVDVLSTDARQIVAGAPVWIEAGPEGPLAARVRRVEPSAFTKVSALGVEEQRVNVIIDFASPPEQRQRLGDNYRVDLRIVKFAQNNAVIAPVSSLFRDGGAWSVFVPKDGRAVKRTVSVGGRTAVDAWIEDGLAAGEQVIVYPSDSVRDGVTVEVVRGAR